VSSVSVVGHQGQGGSTALHISNLMLSIGKVEEIGRLAGAQDSIRPTHRKGGGKRCSSRSRKGLHPCPDPEKSEMNACGWSERMPPPWPIDRIDDLRGMATKSNAASKICKRCFDSWCHLKCSEETARIHRRSKLLSDRL
jgi:hypothetical protein